MFLINSRYPLFYYSFKTSLSRSYRVILPSSFNIINPYALLHLKQSICVYVNTVLVYTISRTNKIKFFKLKKIN